MPAAIIAAAIIIKNIGFFKKSSNFPSQVVKIRQLSLKLFPQTTLQIISYISAYSKRYGQKADNFSRISTTWLHCIYFSNIFCKVQLPGFLSRSSRPKNPVQKIIFPLLFPQNLQTFSPQCQHLQLCHHL